MGEKLSLAGLQLFPYINDYRTEAPTVRNPILGIVREKLTTQNGLSPNSVPSGLSQAPFLLKMPPTQDNRSCDLLQGSSVFGKIRQQAKFSPILGGRVQAKKTLMGTISPRPCLCGRCDCLGGRRPR